MIRYMIMRDLRQFSLIYLIFTMAFAQCIFFVNYNTNYHLFVEQQRQQQLQLHKRIPADENNHQRLAAENSNLDFLRYLLQEYAKLWMDLFKMTLGVYDLEPYRNSYLARVFLLLFIYLIPILFNM